MAARKKKSTGTAMVSWEERLAARAQQAAAKEKVGGEGNFISLRGGEFNYRGDVLENPMQVVVLDTAYENAYFDMKWDPENPAPPACFAVSAEAVDSEDLTPDESSPDLQADHCAECPMNEWGSAEVGNGKACGNNRRLLVIPYEDLDNLDEAEPALIRVPPSSIKQWSGYAKKLTKVMKLPPFAAITELLLEREGDNTYATLKPSFVDAVPEEYLEALEQLVDSDRVRELLETPYDVSGYEEAKAAREKPKPSRRRTATAKKKAAPKKRGSKY